MLLALDTTDGMCNVGVSRENSLLAFSEFSIHRGTSDIIFPQIEKTLMKANITLSQLSGFVVCTGPGNYTSLRIEKQINFIESNRIESTTNVFGN